MAKLRLWGPHPHCQRLLGKGRQRVFPGIGCPSACFTSVTRASLPVLGRHFISYAAAPSTVFKPFSQPLLPPTTLLICPKMLKAKVPVLVLKLFGFDKDDVASVFLLKWKRDDDERCDIACRLPFVGSTCPQLNTRPTCTHLKLDFCSTPPARFQCSVLRCSILFSNAWMPPFPTASTGV